jgi:glycosyl transferase family 1
VRVDIIPSDKVSCAHYRLAWPANAVAAQTDWDVRIHDPGDVYVRRPFAIQGIDDLESVDVVVMQRIATPRQVRLISALQKLGIAVVVDVDDLLSDIDQDNKSWSYWNEQVMDLSRYRYIDQATRMADLVTVSSDYLATKYGRHGRVEVLRNGLPNHGFDDPDVVYERSRAVDGEVVVGWSGSLDSHPHDLDVLGGAVRAAMDNDPLLHFRVVGDAEPVTQALNLDPSRVSGTGWLPFEDYHPALRAVDIGLVPLSETRFNRAKSHLKASEFAAAGAVVLASDLPEQRLLSETVPIATISNTGVGPAHLYWQSHIEAVAMTMREHPEAMAQDRAEVVRSTAQWAYANRAGEWVAAWERAAARRKNLDK